MSFKTLRKGKQEPEGAGSERAAAKAREFRRRIWERARELRVSTEYGDDFTKYMGILASQGKDESYAREAAIFSEVLGWLTRKQVGFKIRNMLDSIPPLILLFYDEMQNAVDANGIRKLVDRLDDDDAGGYIRGTNKIILLEDGKEADRRRVMCHEIIHYCTELGSGGKAFWIGANGRGTEQEYVSWLDEGITELLAQQRTRQKGFEPSFISYEPETLAAFFIARLVGMRTLRMAHLRGDFSLVRERLDSRLGYGSFEFMLKKGDGEAAVAALAKEVVRACLDSLFPNLGIDWSKPLRTGIDIEYAVKKALGHEDIG